MNPSLTIVPLLRLPGVLILALALSNAYAAGNADTKLQGPSPTPAVPHVGVTSPYASFDTFRIIEERNIFDPNRVGRSVRGSDNQPPRGDTISLVGTMHYEKGLFAFFDGSEARFKKSLHEGETIDQYTVTSIGSDSIELTRAGQHFTLAIGQQLRRPVGGDWRVVTLAVVRSEADTAPGTEAAAASPAIPAGASDTLKRLMEQRQKQLKP